jgi:hypothetical protein
MSMQINVDPAGLTQEQREAVAGFILAYPSKACGGTCHTSVAAEIHDNTEAVSLRVPNAVAAAVAANPVGAVLALNDEIAQLAKEGGEFDASVAFGGDATAAAVFGSAPAPLPLGATAAPSIAVAAPSLTVPADTTATTFAAAPNVPAPPALNTAPAAPIAAPQTANPVGAVDLDKHGLPWDGRIHAESKAKIADGTWRKKRGVDPALVATVEAELRQVMGAAPAAAPAVPMFIDGKIEYRPMPTPPEPGMFLAPGVAPHEVSTPALPTAPVAPVAPPPPAPLAAPVGEVPQDARAQFVGLVGRASAAIQAGKVTQAEITQCCAAAGVPALPLLANRLDLVAQVAAQVDAMIAAR